MRRQIRAGARPGEPKKQLYRYCAVLNTKDAVRGSELFEEAGAVGHACGTHAPGSGEINLLILEAHCPALETWLSAQPEVKSWSKDAI